MREIVRRVPPGVMAVLYLLAGAFAYTPVSADNTNVYAISNPAPDLIIETITWSPEIPALGETVTFSIAIKNQGNNQADSSNVVYNLDGTCYTSDTIDRIDPADTITRTFTWKAQAGSHTIEAIADVHNKVTESDETNNTKTFVLSVLAPDLVIKDIIWSPEEPFIRDQVVFTVIIKNQGSSRANCSYVEFIIDNNSRGYRDIPRLEAGATTNTTFTWTAQPGPHSLKAVADVLNKVSEVDETNNSRVENYSTSVPDLIIKTITHSPSTLSENTTVTFTVTVENQGSGKSDPFWLAYYIDDTHQTSVYINQMIPGATVTKTFDWTAKIYSQTFTAVVDATDKILESDETNNTTSDSLPSLAPDLIVESISWSPSSPLVAHRVVFTVTIKNQGKTAAIYSHMNFIIDDYYKLRSSVPALDIGASTSLTFTWTAQQTSHTVQAVADISNFVYEGNEDNNTKTVVATFSQPSPTTDLIVQDIKWTPTNPSAGETVTFTASIKNQGSTHINPSHVAYYIDDNFQTLAYVSEISSGATVPTTFVWKTQAGVHTIKAIADFNNIIAETNEDNNETATDLSIAAPDLVIEGITWSPENPTTGDTVTFTVNIKNQGDHAAHNSYIGYYIDDSSRGYHDVKELDAGTNITKFFTWSAQAGTHTLRAVADITGDIIESNEDNNERIVTFPTPDLIVETITWSPESPTAGDMVTFEVIIRNQGGGLADSSDLHLSINGSSQGNRNIQIMYAGTAVTKTFTWAAQEGTYIIKACADSVDSITETDESNNQKELSLSVLPTPKSSNSILGATPAMASETTPQEQETSDTFEDDTGQVTPEPDTTSDIPEDPSPGFLSLLMDILLKWWPAIAILAVGSSAITILLRLQKKSASK